MKKDSYFQDHWREIEEDRLERYEEMFKWRPEQESLLTPLGLTEGMSVLTNMVSYIKTFKTLEEDMVDAMMKELSDANANGSYLFVLPQFLVTARK